MITLNNTNRILKASVFPLAKEVHFVVYYAKRTPTDFIEDSEIGAITGADNTLLNTLTADESITIKEITLYNNSDTDVSVDLFLNENSLDINLYKVDLKVGKTWRSDTANQGIDGTGVDHITTVDNGDNTQTVTFWGNVGETINLGSIIVPS